jgi:hypothetical protein
MSKEFIDEIKKMSDEDLKKEFIKYFGEEKWNHEEALAKLWPVQLALADYLEIEPIPLIIENIEEDSRYYPQESYIVISSKLISDEVEALKCLIHEMKHYQQFMCVIHNITTEPLMREWKEDFEINYASVTSYEEMLCLPVELDAFAFTKYIMKDWYDINVIHPEPLYEEVICKYIKKYF